MTNPLLVIRDKYSGRVTQHNDWDSAAKAAEGICRKTGEDVYIFEATHVVKPVAQVRTICLSTGEEVDFHD